MNFAPGLILLLTNQFGAELFSGSVSDLIDWLNDPEQNDLNQLLDLETWEGREDVPALIFTFNEHDIASFDLEATRHFLCQLPLPTEVIDPEILSELMGEFEEEEYEEDLTWN